MISSAATAALSGMAFGLSSGVTPGPLLALVIAQTMAHGPREGCKVALAPLLTDTPIVLAAILLTRSAAGHGLVLGALTLCGSAFLLSCAFGCLRWQPPGRAPSDRPTAKGPGSIRKGVLANFLNPGPYLFWMTVGAPLALQSLDLGWPVLASFLGAFSLTIVSAKIGVALLTWRSGPVLGSRGYMLAMKGLGVMLLGYAALFVRDGLRLLGS
ncbi:MAG: lysine transporter LysE [Deltaproteobacteria bacterium HGW-Deltaproteobacteria-8]|jgi:threonine/homoserine/homoserine lactone efflux protein|nr:MAG: lysine transporter LysE [Deltaproteobacteria bacterium HGW-Deltaproteobacteria-8]